LALFALAATMRASCASREYGLHFIRSQRTIAPPTPPARQSIADMAEAVLEGEPTDEPRQPGEGE